MSPLPTFVRSLLDPRPPRGLRVPRVSSVVHCAACGADATEHVEPRARNMGAAAYYGLERDGAGEGPTVALCDACGRDTYPTMEALWGQIADRWAEMKKARAVRLARIAHARETFERVMAEQREPPPPEPSPEAVRALGAAFEAQAERTPARRPAPSLAERVIAALRTVKPGRLVGPWRESTHQGERWAERPGGGASCEVLWEQPGGPSLEEQMAQADERAREREVCVLEDVVTQALAEAEAAHAAEVAALRADLDALWALFGPIAEGIMGAAENWAGIDREDAQGRKWTISAQRADGKTPVEHIRDLSAEIATLRAALGRAATRIEEAWASPGIDATDEPIGLREDVDEFRRLAGGAK